MRPGPSENQKDSLGLKGNEQLGDGGLPGPTFPCAVLAHREAWAGQLGVGAE